MPFANMKNYQEPNKQDLCIPMPNREELACLICEEKSHCQTGEPTAPEWSCKKQLAAADRVIEAGWKSPLECNKCIDESAERVSKLMQSQGHSG